MTTTNETSSELSAPLIWGTILFVISLFTVASTIKYLGILLAVITMICCYAKREKLTSLVPTAYLPLVALVMLSGCSIFYALAKKFALYEFLGLLITFCVSVLLLLFVRHLYMLAGILVVGVTWFSLLSIDLLATQLTYLPISFALSGISESYGNPTGVEVGVRMTSLLGNPNVYGGCAGIAVLLSLTLARFTHRERSTKNKAVKRFYLACLMINSLGFVLAFSMGATATLCLGFLALLWLEPTEKKNELFFLMVETLVFSILAAFPIFYTSFDGWDGINVIPLVCLGLACVALIFTHEKWGATLTIDTKKTTPMILIVVGIIVLYGALGLSIHTPYTYDSAHSINRAVYPDPGEYTLASQSTGTINISIHSQNREETMMHTNTALYYGPLEGATFTVPEDTLVVYFGLAGNAGAEIQEITLSDGTSIPLHYPLLPGFVTTRLQGLFANQNAIQRTVFFEDGMKLFARSPIIGLGMGSFENAVLQVQSFFYETKAVHNHYIQLLLEVGLIGCALFIAMILGLGYGLLKTKERSPFWATSTALMVFIFSHAFVEVIWSSSDYLLFSLGVVTIIALQIKPNPKLKPAIYLPSLAMMLLFTILLCGNLYSDKILKSSSPENYLEDLKRGATYDLFETQDYWISYVYNTKDSTDPVELSQSYQYIKKLNTISSNTIPYYIAQFFLGQNNIEEATKYLVAYVDYIPSRSDAWNQAFAQLLNVENPEEAIPSIELLLEKIETWNEANMGTIVIDATLSNQIEYLLAQ